MKDLYTRRSVGDYLAIRKVSESFTLSLSAGMDLTISRLERSSRPQASSSRIGGVGFYHSPGCRYSSPNAAIPSLSRSETEFGTEIEK